MNYNDWIEELRSEAKSHKDFREHARRFEKRYTLEKGDASDYNIFWANTEILHAALYNKTPKPDVQRRFKDKNPIAREVAAVIERAIEFSLDTYDFDGAVEPALNNYLVQGLGQTRVNYVPWFSAVDARVPVETFVDPTTGAKSYLLDGQEVEGQEDEQGAFTVKTEEEISYQELSCSTVPWSRFRWSCAKDWDTVWWVGEEHYLNEEQMRETFVVRSSENIPLGYSRDAEKAAESEGDLCKVIEIWDKRSRTHFGVVEGMDRLLKFRAGDGEADDDPLKLSGFWPYPKPLAAGVVAGKFIPIPDFAYYETQADEMDALTRRIQHLTDQLRYRGIYDGTFTQLANIVDSADGEFKAIENYAARFGQRGLDSIIATMPLEELRNVVAWLIQAREEVKATIFEITGISDIVRGATKATETLGAQQLKSQFGSMRMSRRQKCVENFIRDIFRIKAEIIAEHFEPEVLQMMTGIEVTPEMSKIMKSDVLRSYNVDVETDSTVLSDQVAEQDSRTQVLTGITQLVSAWAPLAAQAPMVVGLMKELIMFQLGAFKGGRNIEDAVEKVFSEVGDMAASTPVGMVGGPDRFADPSTGNDPSIVQGPRAVGGNRLL